MAIDPTHVRSGNLIYDDGDDLAQITDIALDDPLFADYNPVPLTEEWLASFGFRKINPDSKSGWWTFGETGLNIHFYKIDPTGDETTAGFARPGNRSADIELLSGQMLYGHSLQNFVFGATGLELRVHIVS